MIKTDTETLKVGDTLHCRNQEDLEETMGALADAGYFFKGFHRELMIRIIGKEGKDATEKNH